MTLDMEMTLEIKIMGEVELVLKMKIKPDI